MQRLAFLSACLFSVFTATAQADETLLMRPEVQAFVEQTSRERGVPREVIEATLRAVDSKPSILKIMDRPSTSRPWYQFRPNFLNTALIDGGVAFWAKHAKTLQAVEQQYGVPAEIIVAILGVETRYGRLSGNFRVVDALSTLAFDYPRRASYFKSELAEFFHLTLEENADPLSFVGSYAGAMGMPQFMPSSFRKWAVDFDGDGHRNIWVSPADAIASVANYLQKHGWQKGADIVLPVDASEVKERDSLVADKFNLHYSIAELKQRGVKTLGGEGNDRAKAVLFPLETAAGVTEYWMGLQNFYTITRYNKSTLYAMAVHQLAEEIHDKRLAALAAAASQ
ncbi:lytic murein transglycosylase B [Aquaspirillum serpens]|uniref:lytic murein transglycosylase B n=1 Tax=Aquaspirillum serpens TaxID=190 RepID=UPI0003B449CD|nr:lytic murein transglycosylase B [Aquaspirillum serpens]